MAKECYSVCHFPKVVNAISGMHILILAPKVEENMCLHIVYALGSSHYFTRYCSVSVLEVM